MKNIHLVSTNKPSRLLISKRNNLQFLKDNASLNPNNHFEGTYQNICITNDEEIKEGNWFYNPKWKEIGINYNPDGCKKIILTTDQDLINDGVQAIDDDFLEWFVKNPSYEKVEVQKWSSLAECGYSYHIIIPKEPIQDFEKWFEQFKKK